ncbi:hypothetical protein Lalb_Chr01g0015421 [Lupinus albus]|uniref:Uncharacterized protein n=1 Tax=Lupinus albus TaxID=3870 RepID=A0A6A4R8L2_LUPAL|nr:hypothetical protein Lalb_Chr01g0015421 [Lupinus albus]
MRVRAKRIWLSLLSMTYSPPHVRPNTRDDVIDIYSDEEEPKEDLEEVSVGGW